MLDKYNSNQIKESAFSHLEEEEDNFFKIGDVKTELLYGTVEESFRPFLSLIIPTYRREASLQESLKSVLQQVHVNFLLEILILDNTPLDKKGMTPALKIVKAYCDPRIRYYHNMVNIGSGYNWNRGVELARGHWVSFLHDDDILCKDALYNLKKLIDVFSDLKKPLGYIQARMVKFQNIFAEEQIKLKKLPFVLELTQQTTLLLGHTHTGMPTCGTAVLRDAYIRSGGINYDYGPTADAVLGYRIMRNYTVIRSNVVLGGYRWGENESVNPETIKKLIQSDALFAEYRYRKNFLGKLIGKYFGIMQYESNCLQKMQSIKKESAQYSLWRHCFYQGYLLIIKSFMVVKSISKFSRRNIQCFYD